MRILLGAIVVALASFSAVFTAAQDLAFTAPNLSTTSSNDFTVGEYVGISWTTPFEQTSLILFERGDDGKWNFDTLAGMPSLEYQVLH